MITNITEYLINSKNKYPEKIALIDKKRELTYKDVYNETTKIATRLISEGFIKKAVAVFMDKSVNEIVSFFGCAFSGNYYTVLDDKMPDQRLLKIKDNFQPQVVITDQKNSSKAADLFYDCTVFIYEEVIQAESNNDIVENIRRQIVDTDLLYVLYTSGSTGVPKGVMIPHKSVVNYIEWVTDEFGFSENSIIGNQAPFYFDNSVLDIYSTIKCGASLHIIPHNCFVFPIQLLRYVEKNRINTVFWVPTVLCRVANVGVLDKVDMECLSTVLFAGEVMPAKQLNAWMDCLPNAVFANLYGPTETTVDCIFYIVDKKIPDTDPVPIGKACKNTNILIFNENNNLVKEEEKGEICVRGTSLSYGYYRDEVRTKEAFVQNPLNNLYEEKIYRTGDLGHYDVHGNIIFDGRKDTQIKHAGHRIELGEIENAAQGIEGVYRSCCLFDSANDKLILLYSGNDAIDDVEEELKAKLPSYMIPQEIVYISDMPLNANGKIDRKLLCDSYIRGNA